MITRLRRIAALALSVLAFSPAYALFTLNEGKDQLFVSANYSLGYDTNVFTRATSKGSATQTLSLSAEYSRQAGLIGVSASLSASAGRFESIHGQDFTDPSVSVTLRKRYGRTTGTLSVNGQRVSQPDPDVGARTKSWNYGTSMDVRYPVNDRYYLTNGVRVSAREYARAPNLYSDLYTYSDTIAINYVYTSKLDLNVAYTAGLSDTSKDTRAYDHSLTLGASGSMLPKLSGSINLGVTRRSNDSTLGGRERFNSLSSGTTLKWMFSRRLTFTADLTDGFSTSATDAPINRASAGLHANVSLSNKLMGSSGFTYTISDFLGKAGAGRRDDMLQFDANIGVAITTHLRTSLSFIYTANYSTLAAADFIRRAVTLSVSANY